MRRGCIAVVKVECDNCHRTIEYGKRYLVTDEEKESEKQRLCVECCMSLGYTSYKTEKGGQELISFLSGE